MNSPRIPNTAGARAARLARVKFVTLPMPMASVAPPPPRGLMGFLRSLFRVIGCLEAARP